ncbi:MAG: hypothetical protein RIR49_318 [Actinomycetota bacterium]|jgi:hypothetical protein
MTDHDDHHSGDEPIEDTEHLAPEIRAALLDPVPAGASARERTIAAALTEFDRSGAGVVDIETTRRQRYSRSLSAAAAVLVVAVGISVVVPDGGDDSGGDEQMSLEAPAEEPTAEMSMTRSADIDDDVADVPAGEAEADAPAESALTATEAAPVDDQSDQLRLAETPAELQDLAFVWWQRIRDGSAEPPNGHSCLVAGSSAVAIAEYLGVEVVVFYDGAEGVATALARGDCSPVERVVPDP